MKTQQKMRQLDDTVGHFTPVLPDANWAKYSPAPTVVGGNDPLPPKLWLAALIGYFVLLVLWVGVGATLVYAVDMDATLVTVVWIIVGAIATVKGFALWLDYGSGDKAVRDESKNRLKAHDRAVKAELKVQMRQLDVAEKRIGQDHEFRMAQLAHEKFLIEDQRDARRTEYALAVGKDARDLPLDKPDNFVAARPDPVVPEVCKWVMNMYEVDGTPRADMFHANGWMKSARPWKTLWASEPWSNEAQVLLERLVLEKDGTGHRLRPEFADSRLASVNLAELRGPT